MVSTGQADRHVAAQPPIARLAYAVAAVLRLVVNRAMLRRHPDFLDTRAALMAAEWKLGHAL